MRLRVCNIWRRGIERKPRWCINEDGDGEGDRTLKCCQNLFLFLFILINNCILKINK